MPAVHGGSPRRATRAVNATEAQCRLDQHRQAEPITPPSGRPPAADDRVQCINARPADGAKARAPGRPAAMPASSSVTFSAASGLDR